MKGVQFSKFERLNGKIDKAEDKISYLPNADISDLMILEDEELWFKRVNRSDPVLDEAIPLLHRAKRLAEDDGLPPDLSEFSMTNIGHYTRIVGLIS